MRRLGIRYGCRARWILAEVTAQCLIEGRPLLSQLSGALEEGFRGDREELRVVGRTIVVEHTLTAGFRLAAQRSKSPSSIVLQEDSAVASGKRGVPSAGPLAISN